MLRHISINFFYPLKKKEFEFYKKKKNQKILTRKMFNIEHSAWFQVKENYHIYVPYQFYLRIHSLDQKLQLSHKKQKLYFSRICKKVED